jgi:hypothetical protein
MHGNNLIHVKLPPEINNVAKNAAADKEKSLFTNT